MVFRISVMPPKSKRKLQASYAAREKWTPSGKNKLKKDDDEDFALVEEEEIEYTPDLIYKIMEYCKELVVDNARTHSALMVNINDLRLRPGGNCPLEVLSWLDDNNERQTLELFFKEGKLAGQSKGLKQIALEIGFEMPEGSKLDDYKRILSNHKAFMKLTKLQELAQRYNIKIIYCPKYHCELNPFEGVWCWMKQYIRKRSDQTYNTMLVLVDESREE